MRFSIITPNYNGGSFLEQAITNIISQVGDGIKLEYIIIDGGSTDCSHEIMARYSSKIAISIIEKDNGPANAINKGLALATGDVLAWLNADDLYYPGTLQRVRLAMECRPEAAICFGSCPIIDQQGKEIRQNISRFKEFFYPFSSRFTYQCINYLSQPALFFRRSAFAQAGPLREDMVAAWDYEFILRLWRCGNAVHVPDTPLAAFRWHEQSISGQNFRIQFQEEYEAARADAGRFSPQTFIHFFVRWGIVGIYSLMAWLKKRL
ncbi:MAG: Glycosyltransferase, GT2 family [Candidatus Electronema aureum]|uniref:Glycosyltransferase, GT2 family n=1 Tax=Candidatus Electronema aureum TaxID=2005002 RepID=A0A521G4D6_9BACT|nr:MAG: Glycosyltransferase, GT2 family [Candidatus Electronema aureum]